jgi:hypothetical protein
MTSNKSKLGLLFGSRSSENSDSLSQAKRDLQWIISLSPYQCFAPLWCLSPEACDLEVQMDASNLGYGIWFNGFLHQGLWDSTTAYLHINVLETTALWHFLAFILPKSSNQRNILDRQHHGPSLRQEGRGYMQSSSPGGTGKGAGAPDVPSHTSSCCYCQADDQPVIRRFLLARPPLAERRLDLAWRGA